MGENAADFSLTFSCSGDLSFACPRRYSSFNLRTRSRALFCWGSRSTDLAYDVGRSGLSVGINAFIITTGDAKVGSAAEPIGRQGAKQAFSFAGIPKGWFNPWLPGREQVSRFFPVPGRVVCGPRDCPTVQSAMPCAGWCHPLRRSGIIVTRSLSGFEARAKRSWCGRRDLNPHGPCGPTDFRTRLRLSPPLLCCQGLGSGLSLHRVPETFPVFRCCPSSLYTFPTGKLIAPAGLGSGSPRYRVPRI